MELIFILLSVALYYIRSISVFLSRTFSQIKCCKYYIHVIMTNNKILEIYTNVKNKY